MPTAHNNPMTRQTTFAEPRPRAPQPGNGTATHPSARARARQLAELTRTIHVEPDPRALQHSVIDAYQRAVPAACAVALTTSVHGRLRTAAQTCGKVRELDEIQSRVKDGPCVSASAAAPDSDLPVRCDDLAAERRWPLYAPAAVHLGYRSLLAFRLFVEDVKLGVVTVYGAQPYAFDEGDEETGALLAANAAVALNAKRLETNLRIALESRDVIGQAKGILMERFKLTPDGAFQVLVAVSQHQHRKVRDVAGDLAATGELPNMD